ncbi:MAG: thermonuclease family protein [Bacillota bacterium]
MALLVIVGLAIAAAPGCAAPQAPPPAPPDAAAPGVPRQEEPAPQPQVREDGPAVPVLEALVIKCVDGDTVHVRVGGRTEKVRFTGVNTPELHHPQRGAEPFGREAAVYTKHRLLGKRVYLELDVQERDRYGRLLAYVWLMPPAGRTEEEVRRKMFNAELLLRGYAQVMTVPPNVRYADMFVKFQREAREKGEGLWRQ